MEEFNVVLNVDTVNGRKKINFKDESAVSAEVKISHMMSDKKMPTDLDVVLKISSKDKGKSVDIEMIDNAGTKKSVLPSFSSFFAINISTALKFYLKSTWEDVKNVKKN